MGNTSDNLRWCNEEPSLATFDHYHLTCFSLLFAATVFAEFLESIQVLRSPALEDPKEQALLFHQFVRTETDVEKMRSLLPKKKVINPLVLLKPLRDEKAPRQSFVDVKKYMKVVSKAHSSLEEMGIGKGPFLLSCRKLRARSQSF